MSLKTLPPDARPRERLMNLGAERLSMQELLAILLRTGTRKGSALQLAEDVLEALPGDLLLRATADQLLLIPGLKQAKAATLMAAIELVRRLKTSAPEAMNLSSPARVGEFLTGRHAHATKELFGVLLLDSHNDLILDRVIHEGTTRFAPVEPRFVFAPALNTHAARVIVYHTHPSGDPTPSEDDCRFTARLAEAGQSLGIPLVDHLVLGVRGYYSFKEHHRL